jgi:hypothetical protein
MSKRDHSSVPAKTAENNDDEAPRKKSREEPQNVETLRLEPRNNEYAGYSFQTGPPEIESVDPNTMDANDFFSKFIAARKPCVINGLDTTSGHDNSLSPQDLVMLAGKEAVQVERRLSTRENFGQNRTTSRQVLMKMEEFIDKLSGGDGDMFYLSTQQSPSDEEYPSPFQVPCRQLLDAKKIKETLTLAGNLRLESCNLWMGSSLSGSSSGLHHDYQDNFYLLLQGKKQFRLYSPDTAQGMHTCGTIEKIHFNGVISYHDSETRADGMPMEDEGLFAEANGQGNHDENGDDEEEEEEFVVGKGFDYHSSDEENDFDDSGSDDFEKLEGKGEGGGLDDDSAGKPEDRPNNFCRRDVPDSEGYRECIITLKAGEMLYLPAGWFHCVTSFSTSTQQEDDSTKSGQVHMALNYWYHPPDQLTDFEKPYTRVNK